MRIANNKYKRTSYYNNILIANFELILTGRIKLL